MEIMKKKWYKISDNAPVDRSFEVVLIGKNKHYNIKPKAIYGETLFCEEFFKDNDFKDFLEKGIIQLI
ncbi:hypothetical protein MEO40_17775 [Dolichospermum sp. ST_sed1]|nr:hypothetical protein [Dolichospermum sp. ST_sed1]